jgi:hypothetical protein
MVTRPWPWRGAVVARRLPVLRVWRGAATARAYCVRADGGMRRWLAAALVAAPVGLAGPARAARSASLVGATGKLRCGCAAYGSRRRCLAAVVFVVVLLVGCVGHLHWSR